MARSLLPSYQPVVEEDDYIDMDVKCRDFEFQMSSKPLLFDDVTSPADELFYKGKLLPLHLPPRLELVQKLLRDSDHDAVAATPYESCNVSTTTSCYVSGELNADECFDEFHNYYTTAQQTHVAKKSWTRKFRLKLRVTKAYLKSLFGKSGCSDESCAVREGCGHRRSFSGAIKRRSSNKSSSSCSSSFSSANSGGPQALRRSSSVSSEAERSIQGAIAHCKRSQREVCARKSVSDVEFYTLSACEKQERPEICRG